MTSLIEPALAEHLLVLQARPDVLDQACLTDFRLADWLPLPKGFFEADELDVLAFHLTFGDLEEARRIASEIGEPWPFESETPSIRDTRALLASRPELQRTGMKVLRNLQSFGFVSARDWKLSRWAHRVDLATGRLERVQAELAMLRFTDTACRLQAFVNLALNHTEIGVSAIVLDPGARAQYWFDSAEPSATGAPLQLHQANFETEDDLFAHSWLDSKPERFNF